MDDGGSRRFFGQYTTIANEIARNLDAYADHQTLAELTQNADDAGARRVGFMLDARSHGTEKLLKHDGSHNRLDDLQGPALLAFDSAVFKADDFDGLRAFGRGGKRFDPTKTGKFGLGFNSVYHLTEAPLFVSGEHLVMLDPQYKFLPGLSRAHEPGLQVHLPTEDRGAISDQLAPFNVPEFGCNLDGDAGRFNGTLFRFPLRTEDQAETSELRPGNPYTVDDVLHLFTEFKKEAAELLLFLHHVECIELWIWDPSASQPSCVFKVETTGANLEKRAELATWLRTSLDAWAQKHGKPWKECPHALTDILKSIHKPKQTLPRSSILHNIHTYENGERVCTTSWWLRQGVGLNKAFRYSCNASTSATDKPLWPIGCVAARISTTIHTTSGTHDPTDPTHSSCARAHAHTTPLPLQGRAFATLPTEVSTGYPVHVNARWCLMDNRQALQTSQAASHKRMSDFNRVLIQDTLAHLWAELLLELRELGLSAATYYALWPGSDSTPLAEPWSLVLSPFYKHMHKNASCMLMRSPLSQHPAAAHHHQQPPPPQQQQQQQWKQASEVEFDDITSSHLLHLNGDRRGVAWRRWSHLMLLAGVVNNGHHLDGRPRSLEEATSLPPLQRFRMIARVIIRQLRCVGNVVHALAADGFPLTSTPGFVREHFRKAKLDTTATTPASVAAFYRGVALPQRRTPLHSTPVPSLHNAESIAAIVRYCLSERTNHRRPHCLVGTPLLAMADGTLAEFGVACHPEHGNALLSASPHVDRLLGPVARTIVAHPAITNVLLHAADDNTLQELAVSKLSAGTLHTLISSSLPPHLVCNTAPIEWTSDLESSVDTSRFVAPSREWVEAFYAVLAVMVQQDIEPATVLNTFKDIPVVPACAHKHNGEPAAALLGDSHESSFVAPPEYLATVRVARTCVLRFPRSAEGDDIALSDSMSHLCAIASTFGVRFLLEDVMDTHVLKLPFPTLSPSALITILAHLYQEQQQQQGAVHAVVEGEDGAAAVPFSQPRARDVACILRYCEQGADDLTEEDLSALKTLPFFEVDEVQTATDVQQHGGPSTANGTDASVRSSSSSSSSSLSAHGAQLRRSRDQLAPGRRNRRLPPVPGGSRRAGDTQPSTSRHRDSADSSSLRGSTLAASADHNNGYGEDDDDAEDNGSTRFISIAHLTAPRELPARAWTAFLGDAQLLKSKAGVCPRLYERLGIRPLEEGEYYTTYVFPALPRLTLEERLRVMHEISNNPRLLEDEGVLAALRTIPFVPVRSGEVVAPTDAYASVSFFYDLFPQRVVDVEKVAGRRWFVPFAERAGLVTTVTPNVIVAAARMAAEEKSQRMTDAILRFVSLHGSTFERDPTLSTALASIPFLYPDVPQDPQLQALLPYDCAAWYCPSEIFIPSSKENSLLVWSQVPITPPQYSLRVIEGCSATPETVAKHLRFCSALESDVLRKFTTWMRFRNVENLVWPCYRFFSQLLEEQPVAEVKQLLQEGNLALVMDHSETDPVTARPRLKPIFVSASCVFDELLPPGLPPFAYPTSMLTRSAMEDNALLDAMGVRKAPSLEDLVRWLAQYAQRAQGEPLDDKTTQYVTHIFGLLEKHEAIIKAHNVTSQEYFFALTAQNKLMPAKFVVVDDAPWLRNRIDTSSIFSVHPRIATIAKRIGILGLSQAVEERLHANYAPEAVRDRSANIVSQCQTWQTTLRSREFRIAVLRIVAHESVSLPFRAMTTAGGGGGGDAGSDMSLPQAPGAASAQASSQRNSKQQLRAQLVRLQRAEIVPVNFVESEFLLLSTGQDITRQSRGSPCVAARVPDQEGRERVVFYLDTSFPRFMRLSALIMTLNRFLDSTVHNLQTLEKVLESASHEVEKTLDFLHVTKVSADELGEALKTADASELDRLAPLTPSQLIAFPLGGDVVVRRQADGLHVHGVLLDFDPEHDTAHIELSDGTTLDAAPGQMFRVMQADEHAQAVRDAAAAARRKRTAHASAAASATTGRDRSSERTAPAEDVEREAAAVIGEDYDETKQEAEDAIRQEFKDALAGQPVQRQRYEPLDPQWLEKEEAVVAQLKDRYEHLRTTLEPEEPGVDDVLVEAGFPVPEAGQDARLRNASVEVSTRVRRGYDLVRLTNIDGVAIFHSRNQIAEGRLQLFQQCVRILKEVSDVFSYDARYVTLFYQEEAQSRFIKQKLLYNIWPIEEHAKAHGVQDVASDPFAYMYFYGLHIHKLAHFHDIVHGTRHDYFMNELRIEFLDEWLALLDSKGFDAEALEQSELGERCLRHVVF
ncbi:hypothetical protein PTSG_07901 [Salpingoeca rosetta]|uniref:Sacsin/Nov domain-containing protein n=1 Tax=Salpingoeca rosetta (strain ATCC 50818 / BSB-021) TaxID=946362 RepID=F2UGN3_SALR5|nr:uncharacterized protein PTSG_07901 [Salpingoeca rosetta]EGD75783.1 hypothetical protein PTSG_07901 [Salpingoeca rosetta]|eukprot:XP_004991704.1 hypothetical protein PTSG_07901 [Salpingoeca rosetta]